MATSKKKRKKNYLSKDSQERNTKFRSQNEKNKK